MNGYMTYLFSLLALSKYPITTKYRLFHIAEGAIFEI